MRPEKDATPPRYDSQVRAINKSLLYLVTTFFLVHYHNLDTPIACVSRDMQSILRLFRRKNMRHKLLQVEDTAAQTGDCWRPGVPVAVDEPQVNLVGRST